MNTQARKPFLKLLDSYILDAIDQLEYGQKEALNLIQPKLAKLYGVNGSWQEIVSSKMDFSDTLPEQIRTLWVGYLEKAHSLQQAADPNAFVISFVNQNFPDIVAS